MPLMARALVSWAGSFLFAPDAPEERRLSTPAKYALILALFIGVILTSGYGLMLMVITMTTCWL